MSASPAGWQKDPTGRHELRYWDGSVWTDDVSNAGVTATDVLEPVPLVSPTARPAMPPTSTPPPSASSRRAPVIVAAVVAVLALAVGAFLLFGRSSGGETKKAEVGSPLCDKALISAVNKAGGTKLVVGGSNSDSICSLVNARAESQFVFLAEAADGIGSPDRCTDTPRSIRSKQDAFVCVVADPKSSVTFVEGVMRYHDKTIVIDPASPLQGDADQPALETLLVRLIEQAAQ